MERDVAAETKAFEALIIECLAEATEIVSLIALLQVQNGEGVNKNVSAAGAGGAGIVVRNALISRLVLLTSRAYPPARAGDRHFQRAIDLIADATLRAGYAARESELVAAENFWKKCKGDQRAHELHHFRDKFTAHLGEPKDIPLPSYKDIFAVANATVDAIEKLAFAVGISGPPVRENIDARKLADLFWSPWKDKRPPGEGRAG
jgi:hypothetical protein